MSISPDWHGWSRGESTNLYVGHLPTRKQVAVYTITRHPWVDDETGRHYTGAAVKVLAWCRTEEDAQVLMNLMSGLLGPLSSKEEEFGP